jgi:4a-hydroxytetrahydrobiopterin dehydratase
MADGNNRKEVTCSAAQIEQRLEQELPLWYLENGCICRRYRTGGWQATIMVVNAIAHLAEAAFHHPELEVSYAGIIVRLATHSAGGVTEKDFGLARQIETVVQWQPGREAGLPEAEEGSRHGVYVVYDAPRSAGVDDA